MTKIVTFREYVSSCGHQDQRLIDASIRLKQSLAVFGIVGWGIISPDQYITVKETLETARANPFGSYFIWCNTDVVWQKDPFEGLEEGVSYGFHRTEQPSGEINYGVDAYRIDCKVYDEIISKDIPHLWNGCTHTDWFISRALQRYSTYINLTGYIDHPSHERYPGSAGINKLGQENLRNFNEWADRHGVSKV